MSADQPPFGFSSSLASASSAFLLRRARPSSPGSGFFAGSGLRRGLGLGPRPRGFGRAPASSPGRRRDERDGRAQDSRRQEDGQLLHVQLLEAPSSAPFVRSAVGVFKRAAKVQWPPTRASGHVHTAARCVRPRGRVRGAPGTRRRGAGTEREPARSARPRATGRDRRAGGSRGRLTGSCRAPLARRSRPASPASAPPSSPR